MTQALDISGYFELIASEIETENRSATGQTSGQETDSLTQDYHVALDQQIYPNLKFLAGGFFRRTEATQRTFQPFGKASHQTLTAALASLRREYSLPSM